MNTKPAGEQESACVRLIEPALSMALAYRKFLQEFIDAGEEGLILHHLADEVEDLAACIRRMQDYAGGLNLPEDWVPCSAYWLVSGEGFLLGEIHLRHRLTPALEDYGGHIGYMVRPGARGKNYASRMLALVLEKASGMGLKKVLITCDLSNAASARVIMKNGGVLASESAAQGGRMTSRYWIDL